MQPIAALYLMFIHLKISNETEELITICLNDNEGRSWE